MASPDTHGRLFGRRIPAARFLKDPTLENPICNVALAWDIDQRLPDNPPFGGTPSGLSDVFLRPDLQTLRQYPGAKGVAICLCDVSDREGNLIPIAPRTILHRRINDARQLGYKLIYGPELEMYIFKGDVWTARNEGFRNLVPTNLTRVDYSIFGSDEPFIDSVRSAMEAAGIPIYSYQAEYGLGQWEIDLEHSEALPMADRQVVFKTAVKEMARRAGLSVTFMAKPVSAEIGSSCHFHCSLWTDQGSAALPDNDEPEGLSSVGKHFVGGLMRHLDETSLFFAPYVNSYKRQIGGRGGFGTGLIAWGFDNRTGTFRVTGSGSNSRVEHRYAGADTNPYVAVGAILAAGMDGIRKAIDPGPAVKGDAYAQPGLRHAPASLGEALAAFEQSAFVAETFGTDVRSHYASQGRQEWQAYLSTVTDWEVQRGFERA